jgi:biopolymer transport protein TolQ
LLLLIVTSIFSWAIIVKKWGVLGQAKLTNSKFLKAFRKTNNLESMRAAAEQFGRAPLVGQFDWGYDELERQIKERNTLINRESLERALRIGASEELEHLESNLNWLATIASIAPFVGLFGTVLGIVSAFQNLGAEGTNSLRAVAPGIAEALIATAVGLFAAIPAAIFYNYFGKQVRDFAARMDDFTMEFMNAAERKFGG